MIQLLLSLLTLFLSAKDTGYVTFTASPDKIKFYYKHNDKLVGSLSKVREIDTGVKFVTGGQMYSETYTSLGLYIDNGKRISKASVFNNPSVNFGMQPQGVFAITKEEKALIVPIKERKEADYKYAVQCAPMLVISSTINPQLPHSKSSYVRSGYGILKDGRVMIAISKQRVNFREFAQFFVDQGCTEAVYIDGAVPDYWTPSHPARKGAQFGVIVGAF